ncbi:hypothetical protein ASPZODRAFT_2063704 [Penicilliopsis zonata CBS 506.65]|uniref:Uncharacterized protein n=1 Tax=Penicilliopsis zonata CBS 506.65 TaxID=1073090 RepID=A0A1L9SG22_9EURO|nr:hypothetical protein ASPZODRAFT_2063704 [Penicilliopsis zonata CBS 506.65]OJJ46139.1 hypothetical protein ASPZODRAFT_2063704 [Penicilliopsis zonata CBS 506.65]
MQGSFCTSLRSRQVWRVLEPVLSSFSPKLQECHLGGHDFDFHDLSAMVPLRVVLLTSSCLDDSNKQETHARLQRLSHTTDIHHAAVALLLSDEPFALASERYNLEGLMGLQVLMAESQGDPLPVIPIADASSFFSSVHDYYTGRLATVPISSPSPSRSISLMAHATCSAPLNEQDTHILSDLFPSLPALSQATRSREGRAILDDYFGSIGGSILQFWGGSFPH